MKTLVIRAVVVAFLVLFSWLAWKENHKPDAPGPAQISLTEDSSDEVTPPAIPEGGYRNSAVMFTYILFVAIGVGVIALKWLIPAIGDRIGETFYSAPEKAEQSETQKAMALVAQGEYHKALAAFQKILAANPTDRFAVMESAKIHQQKLGDLDAAVEVLESAAKGEWPEDDKCFFLIKLADIHAAERSDFARARELLDQLIQSYPNSHQAANAHHKLREIEEQEFMARQQQH